MKRIKTVLVFCALMYAFPVPGADSFYENCIESGMKEQMQGMKESDRESVKVGVEGACKMLLKECEDNPDGEMCKIFRQKYGNG